MILLVLVAASGAGQEPPSPPVFSETVDVRVVNLEVVVTDRQGERVRGLGVEDFELLLDGEPIAIDYFSEIDDGVVQEPGDRTSAAPGLEAGEELATSYLVFIDDFFSVKRDRNRVLGRLMEQASGLAEEDRMAVVRYDGRTLERLAGWSSGERLQAALAEARTRESRGLQRLMEDRQFLEPSEIDALQRDLAGSQARLTLEERSYVERLEGQLERVVSAGVSTLRSFAAPPGRKVMLILSGGWPRDPVEYVVGDLRRALEESWADRTGELFHPLRDTANLLGYTLYPVDVPGFQSSAIEAGTRSLGPTADRVTGVSYLREQGKHRTLEELARDTGGRALLNSRRDDLLDVAVEDTRSYYWLGFDADRSGDDQLHDLEVRVARPGLEVRSRSGYFDFSRRREVTLAVESALYFGAPPSENPLDVRLGRARRSGLRTMVLPLELLIPAEAVTLLPSAEGWVGQVELRVAVLDEDGATADTPVIPLTLRLPERPSGDVRLSYETQLELRRKDQTLVVAVYDVPSGGILSSSVEVSP